MRRATLAAKASSCTNWSSNQWKLSVGAHKALQAKQTYKTFHLPSSWPKNWKEEKPLKKPAAETNRSDDTLIKWLWLQVCREACAFSSDTVFRYRRIVLSSTTPFIAQQSEPMTSWKNNHSSPFHIFKEVIRLLPLPDSAEKGRIINHAKNLNMLV